MGLKDLDRRVQRIDKAVREEQKKTSNTHDKFVNCLDKAKKEFSDVTRVSMNGYTLTSLMNAMHFPYDTLTISGVETIYGATIEIDSELPDDAFKIAGAFYSDGTVKCRTCHRETDGTIYGECVRCVYRCAHVQRQK